MSPQLERLAEARFHLWGCEPGEEKRLKANYDRLFWEIAEKLPAQQRLELDDAIRFRALQIRKARNRPRLYRQKHKASSGARRPTAPSSRLWRVKSGRSDRI